MARTFAKETEGTIYKYIKERRLFAWHFIKCIAVRRKPIEKMVYICRSSLLQEKEQRKACFV